MTSNFTLFGIGIGWIILILGINIVFWWAIVNWVILPALPAVASAFATIFH
jgi:hypothetical protein